MFLQFISQDVLDEHGLDVRHFSPIYRVLLLAKLILSNWFKTIFLSKEYIRRYSFKNIFVTDFQYSTNMHNL